MLRIRKALLFLVPVCVLAAVVVVAHFGSPGVSPASSFLLRHALAADSCTNWMRQKNGCDWRTCVDEKGRQYCQQACGNTISRVNCK